MCRQYCHLMNWSLNEHDQSWQTTTLWTNFHDRKRAYIYHNFTDALTHWPLRDVKVTLHVYFLNHFTNWYLEHLQWNWHSVNATDPIDENSTLVQAMAWSRQATSHYLKPLKVRSVILHCSLKQIFVILPQWVNIDLKAVLIMAQVFAYQKQIKAHLKQSCCHHYLKYMMSKSFPRNHSLYAGWACPSAPG